jgi:beta-galactosidase
MNKVALFLMMIPMWLNAGHFEPELFNGAWQFRNQEDFVSLNLLPYQQGYDFTGWENVTLPHSAKIEPKVIIKPWSGISWYKKDFVLNGDWKSKKVFIEFEGVMQKAEVWVNGVLAKTNYGGYLPFTMDITALVRFDLPNRIVVKTDNADHPEIPPGKTIATLDFCYYSGIYRNVHIYATEKLYVTDNNYPNKVASGGLRIWFPEVTKNKAVIATNTHIQNDDRQDRDYHLRYELLDATGKSVLLSHSPQIKTLSGRDTLINHHLSISNPNLWHPDHPYLYTLKVSIIEKGKILHQKKLKTGIRKFDIKDDRMYINDEAITLTGTNRHQEYPYIGNALSDQAQYRDAVKIKEAGFNIVRLSHYPQAVAFLDACDALGILTINAIPGWQYVGNEVFMERSYVDARNVIRRDRNHASVIMWELSLNESEMPDTFMKRMQDIAKEESPEAKLITCGWIDRYYDVFIPARQHAKFPDYWKKYNGRPLFISEYGDWEYYAQDAGLNQMGYAGLPRNARNSRQLRTDGEKRLLQQALNFQEAHNDNLINPHLGDANWLMFDYNRGYSPDIEASGIMDIFRLPKFAYYFYRTQNKASQFPNKAYTIKIASFWNEKSDPTMIKIYANCDEVALYLNGKMVERKKKSSTTSAEQLPFPPYIFSVKAFEAGELKAIGYQNGKIVAKDAVNTAGKPTQIKVSYDKSQKTFKADGADVIFVYATICDKNGYTVHDFDSAVNFSVIGDAKIIGENPIKAEAGIATILLQAGNTKGIIQVKAQSDRLTTGRISIPITK